VTGAAQRIGRATAELLLEQGWRVGAADIDADGLGGLGKTHPEVVPLIFDIRDADAWGSALREVTGPAGGRLDLLVNNAAIFSYGAFSAIPLQTQRNVIDVNLGGLVTACYQAFPFLSTPQPGRGRNRRGPRTVVVNLCSATALYGQPGMATYAATKAGIRAITEALQLEWRSAGIRVLDVLPPYVATRMADAAVMSRSEKLLGVRQTPADIAKVIVAAAQRPRRPGLLRSPHVPAGGQATAFTMSAALSPLWATRLTVWALTGGRDRKSCGALRPDG
jgi:NAD(P)-dependent dehydrogenase (short-subunit alcohol dehydrogenase family)